MICKHTTHREAAEINTVAVNIVLICHFIYDGLDYRITIPGSAVKLDPSIKWYGPKCLFPMFYMYGTDTLPAVQAYVDKYES